MSLVSKEILVFPDPRLRKPTKLVKEVDGKIVSIMDEMFEIMYEAPGIGLAAPQVNVHYKIAVVDVSEEKDSPLYLINPEIISFSGEEEMEEGCLSVPGVSEVVRRPAEILLKAVGRDGNEFEMEADGLLAVCIQHELDHLNGKLFIDHLSSLKRGRIKKKLEKEKKSSR